MMQSTLAALAAAAISTLAQPVSAQTTPATPPVSHNVNTKADELKGLTAPQLDVLCDTLLTKPSPAPDKAARSLEYKVCAGRYQQRSAKATFFSAVLSGESRPVCAHIGSEKLSLSKDGAELTTISKVVGVVSIKGAELTYTALPSGKVTVGANINKVSLPDRDLLGIYINLRDATRDFEIHGNVGCTRSILVQAGAPLPSAPAPK